MPKSKRNRVVHLTKVKKKNANDTKKTLVERMRKSFSTFKHVFVFEHQNMTTNPFRAIQAELKDSKFLLGKNRVMQIALGRNEKDEPAENLHKLSEYLKGDCGLLCTDRPKEEIIKYFEQDLCEEYAKAGEIAQTTVIIPKGFQEMEKFAFSMEPHLRKLGMNTSLINAKIHLNEDFVLAEMGKPLTAEQCRILKLFGIKLAKFRINLKAVWGKGGSFLEF